MTKRAVKRMRSLQVCAWARLCEAFGVFVFAGCAAVCVRAQVRERDIVEARAMWQLRSGHEIIQERYIVCCM